MARFKVLPLQDCFSGEKRWWFELVNQNEKIEPFFHRNGFYFDRINKYTWVEINGEAYKYSKPSHFEYELKMSIGNNRIHNNLFQSLKTLIGYRLATKKQKEIYSIEHDMRQIYNPELRINGFKAIKRFEKFKKDHNLK